MVFASLFSRLANFISREIMLDSQPLLNQSALRHNGDLCPREVLRMRRRQLAECSAPPARGRHIILPRYFLAGMEPASGTSLRSFTVMNN